MRPHLASCLLASMVRATGLSDVAASKNSQFNDLAPSKFAETASRLRKLPLRLMTLAAIVWEFVVTGTVLMIPPLPSYGGPEFVLEQPDDEIVFRRTPRVGHLECQDDACEVGDDRHCTHQASE